MEIDESLFRFAMKNDILVWILNDWLNWKNDWLCNLHRFCKLVIFALSTAHGISVCIPNDVQHCINFFSLPVTFSDHLPSLSLSICPSIYPPVNFFTFSSSFSEPFGQFNQTKHKAFLVKIDIRFFFSRTIGPISTKEDGWIWWIKCPFNTKYRLLESAFTLSVFMIECSVLHVDTCSTTPSPTQPVLQTTTFFFCNSI